MKNPTFYRIQDAAGRGPFKPGFSSRWVREDPDMSLVPWLHDIGAVHLNALEGEHVGYCCETITQLQRWINAEEYRRLIDFGYRAVSVRGGRVLGRSSTQAVVARSAPFTFFIEPFNLYELAAQS